MIPGIAGMMDSLGIPSPARRRRNRQVERSLQHQIVLQLKAAYPWLICVAVPNSVYLPARSEAEKTLAKRLIYQLKAVGGLTPGAPDLILAGRGRVAFIEMKVPKSRDLLGKTKPAGRLSDEQRIMAARCEASGVPFYICHIWQEVRAAIEDTWRPVMP